MNNPLMDAASGNTKKCVSADETMIYNLASQEDRAEMARLLYESIETATPGMRYHEQSDKYIYVHDCLPDSNGKYTLSSLTFPTLQKAIRYQEQRYGDGKYGPCAFAAAAEEDRTRWECEQDPDRYHDVSYQYDIDRDILQKQHMAVFKLALLLSEAIKVDTTQHDFTHIINGKECRVSAKVDYTIVSDIEKSDIWAGASDEYRYKYELEQRVIHLNFIIRYTVWLPNGEVQKETDKFLIQCSAHEQYAMSNEGRIFKDGNHEGRVYYSIVARECLICDSNGDVKDTSYDLKYVYLPVFMFEELDERWHDCCYNEVLDLYDGMKYFDSCLLPTNLQFVSNIETGKFDFIHIYDYLTEYSFCRFPDKETMSCADMQYAWEHSEHKGDPNHFLMTIYSSECLGLKGWSLVNRVGFNNIGCERFYIVPRVPGEDVDSNSEVELSSKMVISNVFSNFEYAMVATEHFINELSFWYRDCFHMSIWDKFRVENGTLVIPNK